MLVICLVVGLGLILYPSVSDYWNTFHQSRAIVTYDETVANIDATRYKEMLDSAREYNDRLAEEGIRWEPAEAQMEDYAAQLDVTGTGIMAYIEIPRINCLLPIYHGTEDSVLQIAVGHYEGSSLPVGGTSSHCMLFGHRGLPSARLFTDLDQLREGDTFTIRTLNETYTYEIDQVRTVLPYELDDLRIEPGQDLCSLITCTPYGVNSHRMLVRGYRTENTGDGARITGDAFQIDSVVVAIIVGAVILILVFIAMQIKGKHKRLSSEALARLRNHGQSSHSDGLE